MDANMGSLMSFLRNDPEYKGKKPLVTEGRRPAAKRVNEETKKKLDPSKPNVDHEAVGAETYEDADLEKVKSQTLKNVDFAVRQVKDEEVETPIPVVKAPAKESKGFLQLCEECAKTFRSMKSRCPVSEKHHVERIVAEKKLCEGVLELTGEIEGLEPGDVQAVRHSVETGQIPNEWPSDDEMIDLLSGQEDVVDPSELDADIDIKMAYLKHVLVPKALSMKNEGKVPSKDDDDSKIIKKLTEERDEWRDRLVTPLSEALEDTNLGYYHSSSRKGEDGTLVYEFTSVDGGPAVEVHVKPVQKAEEK